MVIVVTKNQTEDGTLQIEIIDEPIRFRLHGKWSVVENHRYGEVGLRLMNEMWKAVKDAKVQTTGITAFSYSATAAFAPTRYESPHFFQQGD